MTLFEKVDHEKCSRRVKYGVLNRFVQTINCIFSKQSSQNVNSDKFSGYCHDWGFKSAATIIKSNALSVFDYQIFSLNGWK
jgi:hypothetical protein